MSVSQTKKNRWKGKMHHIAMLSYQKDQHLRIHDLIEAQGSSEGVVLGNNQRTYISRGDGIWDLDTQNHFKDDFHTQMLEAEKKKHIFLSNGQAINFLNTLCNYHAKFNKEFLLLDQFGRKISREKFREILLND